MQRKLTILVLIAIGIQPAFAQSQSDKISTYINNAELEKIAAAEYAKYSLERALISRAVENGQVSDRVSLGENVESQLKSLSTGAPIYYITDNVNAAISIGANKLHSGGGLGYTLNGQSIQLGEWDGGSTLVGHQEFGNRATQIDNASNLSNHATHVAGTMIASGVQSNAKGIAPQASLKTYDWNNDNSEMATAASNGLILSNHSYGIVSGWAYGPWATGSNSWHWFGDPLISTMEDYKFGYYSSSARVWDQIANNAPNYLIVKSAGNDRNDSHSSGHYVWQNGGWSYSTSIRNSDGNSNGYDCISGEGVSKNVMTIGAVDDVLSYSHPSSVTMSTFSGWGPTDDGRIKPDLVANGVTLYSSLASGHSAYGSMSGTSMSAPSATGGLGLIQQHANGLHNSYLKSATLKALAIHTAKEAGSAQGPDYQFGWGLLDVERAVEVLDDSLSIVNTHSLVNSTTYTTNIFFSSNPVRITIVWNDPAGTPVNSSLLNNPTSMLVNDLDLRLTAPSGQVYYPYVLNPNSPSSAATTGDNSKDNVEMIDLPNGVAPGLYTLTISHKGNLASSQEFSLIVTGIIQNATPPSCQGVFVQQPQNVQVDASIVSSSFQAPFTDNSAMYQWQLFGGAVPNWTNIPAQGQGINGSTGPILTVFGPSAYVGYSVRCVVTYGNSCTSISNSASFQQLNLPISGCLSTDSIFVTASVLCGPDSVSILIPDPQMDTLPNESLMPISLRNGNVAWLPFNGNGLDYSGNQNHAILGGVQYSQNRLGLDSSSLSFSGTNSFAVIQSSQSLNSISLPGSEDYSISFWIVPDTSAEGVVFARVDTSGDGSMLAFTNSGLIHFVTFLQDKISMVSSPVVHGIWQNITISQGAFLSMFRNGVLTDTSSIQGCLCTNTTLPLMLSVPSIDTTIFPAPISLGFGGEIDDFGVWNRSLSNSEAILLYQSVAQKIQSRYYYVWNQGLDTNNSYTTFISGDTSLNFDVVHRISGASCQVNVPIYLIQPEIHASRLITCSPGDSVLLFDSNVSDTTINKSLLWSSGASIDSIWVTPTQTTTYWLQTSLDGVVCIDSLEVQVLSPSSASITSAITSNNNQTSISLTATPGVSYLWSDSSSTQVLSVYPDSTTTYSVIVYDTNGCYSTASYTVSTIPITFMLDLSTQTISVNKGVHIAGNFQGWTANTSAMAYDLGLGAWVFTREFVIGDTIFYKFINGNDWLDPHDVLLNGCGIGPYGDRWLAVGGQADSVGIFHLSSCDNQAPINPLMDSIAICANTPVQLMAPSTLTDILWSTGDTTQTIGISNSGVVWLSALYPSGVAINDTVQIVHFAAPSTAIIASGNTSLCPGEDVTLTTDTLLVSDVLWIPTQDTTTSIVTVSPGSYFAQLTTIDGCVFYSDTIVVSSLSAPSSMLTLSDSTYFCLGDTLSIAADTGHSYIWNNGDQDSIIIVTNSGDYWVEITSNYGCTTQSDTVTAVMLPGVVLPVLFISNAFAANGDTSNIKMIPYDQSMFYTWSIVGGNIIAGQGGENVDILWQGIPGDTAIVQLVVDNGLCLDSATLNIYITTVGIGESPLTNFKLYPNPADQVLNVEGMVGELHPISYVIYNSLGENVQLGILTESISIESLPSGTYILKISDGANDVIKKFVKMQ